jgi:hypothetical protein
MTDPRGIPMGYAEAASDMAPQPAAVERVARAIEGPTMTDGIWAEVPAAAKERMLERGRRAIAALPGAAPAAPPPEASGREGIRPIDIAYMRGKDEGYAQGVEDAAKLCELHAADTGTSAGLALQLRVEARLIRVLAAPAAPPPEESEALAAWQAALAERDRLRATGLFNDLPRCPGLASYVWRFTVNQERPHDRG